MILFDIIASQDTPLAIKELPYAFQAREAGEMKMGGRVALEYLGLVAAKLSGDLVSPRMVFFGLVGLSGVAVHMGVLWAAHAFMTHFAYAQALAGFTAMTSNYAVNNAVTYRDRLRRAGAWRAATCGSACSAASGWRPTSPSASSSTRTACPGGGRTDRRLAAGAVWNYVSTYLGVW